MLRNSILTFCLLLVPIVATAQPPIEPTNGKMVYRLTLTPARPAQPLTRTALLRAYRDSFQGNAVMGFLGCFSEQTFYFSAEQVEKRDKLLQLPINHPDVAAAEFEAGNLIDVRMRDAARMLQSDWQIWHQLRRDGIGTLLPNEQKMRSLAQPLKVRVRGEIAADKPYKAIHTLQTLFALGRTFETHPTLIGYLVGTAISTMGLDTIEELIQNPNCPNLYWNLTNLPNPFISMAIGWDGDRLIDGQELARLVSEQRPATTEEIAAAIQYAQAATNVGANNTAEWSLSIQFAYQAADPDQLEIDRKLLIETGLKPNLVAAMSPTQVVVAADYRRMEMDRDAITARAMLPTHQALPALKNYKRTDSNLSRAMLPAMDKIRQTQARLEQRIAVLRVIEALRMHAADHNTLPNSLDQVTLPLPNDPVSGQPFRYTLNGETATIECVNPVPPSPTTHRVYELKLRK